MLIGAIYKLRKKQKSLSPLNLEAQRAIKKQPGTSPGQLVRTRAHDSPLDIVENCQRKAKANNQSEKNCSREKVLL